MMNIRGHTESQTNTLRRTALTLLATLAVTAGTVAAPLAGTAHAGGAAGGIVMRRSTVGSLERVTLGGRCWGGQEPRISATSIRPDCPPAMPGPVQAPDDGRKPGAAGSSGV